MNIFIYPNFEKNNAFNTTIESIEILLKLGFKVFMDTNYESQINNSSVKFESIENIEKIDVIIVIGGDGTILKVSKTASKLNIPLLGINTGRLGFMASIERDNLDKLELLKMGQYKINRRNMLKIEIESGGKENEFTALNDAVFSRSPESDLPLYTLLSNGVEVSKVMADGVIFSTPTGSTAYALAAGGPIIEPDISCIEVTQICAHSLFSRPMIFSADKKLSLKVEPRSADEISLLVDGSTVASLTQDAKISISVSELYTQIIDINESAFYKAIDKKLMTPIK